MVNIKTGKTISCVICKKKLYVFKSDRRKTCGGKCRDKLASIKLTGRIFSEEHMKNLKNRPDYCFFQKGNQHWKLRDHKKLKELLTINNQKPEFRAKISKTVTKLWEDKEYKEKVLKKMLNNKRVTSYEKKVIDVINKYKLPYKFVGNGKCFINWMVPDFINTDGKKILVEVYSVYHKKHYYGTEENYKKERIKNFSKYGYKTIFINDNQLNEESVVKLLGGMDK